MSIVALIIAPHITVNKTPHRTELTPTGYGGTGSVSSNAEKKL